LRVNKQSRGKALHVRAQGVGQAKTSEYKKKLEILGTEHCGEAKKVEERHRQKKKVAKGPKIGRGRPGPKKPEGGEWEKLIRREYDAGV